MREQTETGYWMSVRECGRIRQRVRAIREPLQWPKTLAWTAGSLAAGAMLTLLPWNATYGLLPDDAKLEYAWVGTTLLLVAVFCVVLIVASIVFHRSNRGEIVRDKQSVIDLVDAIEDRYRASDGDQDPPAL